MNIVSLVSHQAMPNVLPVLMYKPKNVFLLSTPEELGCGKHLQKLFTKKGIKVFLYDNVSAYDNLNLNKILDDIFHKHNDDLHLNLTGGTKLMAIAAYEYFRKKGKPVYYCNTEHMEIINLLPFRNTEVLKTILTIEDYLAAYGYKIVKTKSLKKEINYEEFFELLEKENLFNEFIQFTSSVRKAFSENINQTIISKQKTFSFQKTPSNFILGLNIGRNNRKYKFTTRDFIFGDWLEYYVYGKMKLSSTSQVELGVKIVSENNVENEIDLLILKNYKLYLISCKSGKTENSALYELETLRSLAGGTFSKGVAIILDKIAKSDNLINRAKGLNIDLISDLVALKDIKL
jgi:hypothetical protein